MTQTASNSRRGRRRLDGQLHDMDQRLIAVMSELTDRIDPVTRELLSGGDDGALRVAAGRRRTDCVELERSVHAVLATQSPVGRDLRHALAVMRACDHVRRSGALLGHVASSRQWITAPSLPPGLCAAVAELADHATTAFRRGVDMWDGPRVAPDDLVTQHRARVACAHAELRSELLTTGCSTPDAVTLGLVGRYLMRIAHHGVALTGLPAEFARPHHDASTS